MATQRSPARFAASTPLGESSMAIASDARTPRHSSTAMYRSGSGFALVTSSRQRMQSKLSRMPRRARWPLDPIVRRARGDAKLQAHRHGLVEVPRRRQAGPPGRGSSPSGGRSGGRAPPAAEAVPGAPRGGAADGSRRWSNRRSAPSVRTAAPRRAPGKPRATSGKQAPPCRGSTRRSRRPGRGSTDSNVAITVPIGLGSPWPCHEDVP